MNGPVHYGKEGPTGGSCGSSVNRDRALSLAPQATITTVGLPNSTHRKPVSMRGTKLCFCRTLRQSSKRHIRKKKQRDGPNQKEDAFFYGPPIGSPPEWNSESFHTFHKEGDGHNCNYERCDEVYRKRTPGALSVVKCRIRHPKVKVLANQNPENYDSQEKRQFLEPIAE